MAHWANIRAVLLQHNDSKIDQINAFMKATWYCSVKQLHKPSQHVQTSFSKC